MPEPRAECDACRDDLHEACSVRRVPSEGAEREMVTAIFGENASACCCVDAQRSPHVSIHVTREQARAIASTLAGTRANKDHVKAALRVVREALQ